MAKVLMYLTASCPFCQSAERLLQREGRRGREDPRRPRARAARRDDAEKRPPHGAADLDRRRHVGGCDDLYALERAGELDPLLKAA